MLNPLSSTITLFEHIQMRHTIITSGVMICTQVSKRKGGYEGMQKVRFEAKNQTLDILGVLEF